ncbi:MAG: hypothetical protein ACNS62_02850 [Candidatus Cyclobacteriaceae bacterium M3_2C_046]
MKKEVSDIQQTLLSMLEEQVPPLKLKTNTDDQYEFTGTKPVMQGKKKVDGMYFASIIAKAKDVRLYFFPIYTHPAEFEHLSPQLRKYLKGKSCFHIKNLSKELEDEIKSMVDLGLRVYQKEELV